MTKQRKNIEESLESFFTPKYLKHVKVMEEKRMKRKDRIDVILLGLVPKIVDKKPEILRDAKKYWEYAEAQAHEFLGKLPEYTAGLTEQKLKKEKSTVYTCKDSSIDLVLGFKPGFMVYDRKGKVIACPLYDLLFKHIEPNPTEEHPWAVQPTSWVIQEALKHFFVYQQDMDAGTLKVAGFNGEERVIDDLHLLERYLAKGTIVHARTDFGGSVGESRYRI